MKELKLDVNWNVPAKVIYNALLSNFEMMKCTRGPVKLEAKEGGEFVFYDGKVQGTFEKLIPNEKIVQKWKFKEWSTHSTVTYTFVDYVGDDECDMKIEQKGIPDGEDLENIRKGWYSQILEPLKIICGFPMRNESNN